VERRGRSEIDTFVASPTASAVGALLADVAVVVLPLADGRSQLSNVLSTGIPLRAKVAYVLLLFAFAIAIVVGIVVARRGAPEVASGVFLGLSIVLALRVIASILTTFEGWVWQTTVVIALQTVACALLLLAARAACRSRSAT
jgi:hypothetical protein